MTFFISTLCHYSSLVIVLLTLITNWYFTKTGFIRRQNAKEMFLVHLEKWNAFSWLIEA